MTVLSQTPTAFAQLTAEEAAWDDRLPLRWVVLGGEALHFTDLRRWMAKYGDANPGLVNMYGITETPQDVWSLVHSFGFGFSVWEMWGPLLTGGSVVVMPTETVRDPKALREALRQARPRPVLRGGLRAGLRPALAVADPLLPRVPRGPARLRCTGPELSGGLRGRDHRAADGRPGPPSAEGQRSRTSRLPAAPPTSRRSWHARTRRNARHCSVWRSSRAGCGPPPHTPTRCAAVSWRRSRCSSGAGARSPRASTRRGAGSSRYSI